MEALWLDVCLPAGRRRQPGPVLRHHVQNQTAFCAVGRRQLGGRVSASVFGNGYSHRASGKSKLRSASVRAIDMYMCSLTARGLAMI